MQVKLTKLYRTDTDKQGNQLKTKDGRNYTRLSIKTEEHGDKWISGFDNAQTKAWKDGDTVEVEIDQKGEYLNFRLPKKEVANAEDLKQLKDDMFKVLTRLGGLINEVAIIKSYVVPKNKRVVDDNAYPSRDDEGLTDEQPFEDETPF